MSRLSQQKHRQRGRLQNPLKLLEKPPHLTPAPLLGAALRERCQQRLAVPYSPSVPALPCPWLSSALLQDSAQPAAPLGCLGCGRGEDATRVLESFRKDFPKGRSGFKWLLEQLRRAQVARVLQKQARIFAARGRVEDLKTSRDHTLDLPGEHPSEISHGERLGGEENHITSAFRSRGGTRSRQTISITAIREAKPLQEMLKRSNFDIVSNHPGMSVHRAG